MKKKVNIAIFASGRGSNARTIVEYFKGHPYIRVVLILSNRRKAGVFDIATENNIPKKYFSKEEWQSPKNIIETLHANNVNVVVLAGFLLLIHREIINNFQQRILNIHPSLLPKHGGKGMYGSRVHEAVKACRDTESGMTIHLVNEKFDEGRVLFQEKVPILPSDSAEAIASKVLKLEHRFYAPVIESYIESQF